MTTLTATATATATPDATSTAALEKSGAGADAITPLPLWFFGFEAVLASAYDLCRADPHAVYVVGGLVVVNILLTTTVLRSRVRLARRLWRGKSTRKTAIALLALRLGSHFALMGLGARLTTPVAHYAFAVVMAVTTVALLWFAQRTALRALAAAGS